LIPKSHPRAKSLLIRENLVSGFDNGLVAKEGLLAHGRGEAFDYLLGEKTGLAAKKAIRAAAAQLILAHKPVISINGNVVSLCPKEIVRLAKASNAKIEVNLFYSNEARKRRIVNTLKKYGAKEILGTKKSSSKILSGTDSARRRVDKDGIFSADVVLVPLEDGDRTKALRKAGKKVITFDLNPLSRTAQTANITIVDNIVRSIEMLIEQCEKLSKKNSNILEKTLRGFNNKKNLADSILQIKNNLSRGAKIA
ncbi:MAG: 4-phosphopantoate--beta-alanine ligase, partial [Nitrosopumilaceae archaeon]|nr:4-phosphopantoate--beta-alanine ligase [Nitrosopumilaceae archaeon]